MSLIHFSTLCSRLHPGHRLSKAQHAPPQAPATPCGRHAEVLQVGTGLFRLGNIWLVWVVLGVFLLSLLLVCCLDVEQIQPTSECQVNSGDMRRDSSETSNGVNMRM